MIVRERTTEDAHVARPCPEQPARTPDTKPVRLVVGLTVVEVSEAGGPSEHDDEVGVSGPTGEQGAAPLDDLGPAEPGARHLDPEPRGGHPTEATGGWPTVEP